MMDLCGFEMMKKINFTKQIRRKIFHSAISTGKTVI